MKSKDTRIAIQYILKMIEDTEYYKPMGEALEKEDYETAEKISDKLIEFQDAKELNFSLEGGKKLRIVRGDKTIHVSFIT